MNDTGPERRRKPWRRTGLGEPEQVSCWRCEAETGVETSAVVQVVQAPRRTPGGKLTGGRKVWACAHCLGRGHVTELVRA